MSRATYTIPSDLKAEMEAIAEKRGVSVAEVLRGFIRVGLVAAKIKEDPNAKLIIRENGQERELVLL